MHDFLDFQDSEILSCQREDAPQGRARLHIRFAAAYVLRQLPAAGARLHGYLAGVELYLDGVEPHTMPSAAALQEAIGALAGGSVCSAGGKFSQLPLPSQHEGPLQLELKFHRRADALVLTAQRLRLSVADPSQFVESLAC